MILKQHMTVARVIFIRYTRFYVSRRWKDPTEPEFLKQCSEHGIRIDTNEHNRKLTVTIELL